MIPNLARAGLDLLLHPFVVLTVFIDIAVAQAAPLHSHWQPLHVRSGVHGNPTQVVDVVWREFVVLPDGSPWLRLEFSKVGLESGSYLRIVSARDGDVQTLNRDSLEQWSFRTAFFNGNAVMIEIVAGPLTQNNFVEIERVMAGDMLAEVPELDTICGGTDDRTLSNDPRAGRLLGAGGCSAWIIGQPTTGVNRLHLSAGHCFSNGAVLQFNVPSSSADCALVHPPASSQFAVDYARSVWADLGAGNDWWVFACFPNSNTGLTTFQTQNAVHTLATVVPPMGTTLVNWGYGVDGSPVNGAPNAGSCGCANPNGLRNQTQQTHTGSITSVVGTVVSHSTDTCNGSSGSVLADASTGYAVAIHTAGGCSTSSGDNFGTAVTNAGLRAAIMLLAGGSEYLKASNTESNDGFGDSVSISGNTIVVGAMLEDSNAVGVNGNQSNNLAPSSGAAYVFVRNGAGWSHQAYLKASNTESYDLFGASVSISGDTIVVGAPGEDSNSIGVNGNQNNNLSSEAGAAYVFTRNGSVWSQQAYLKRNSNWGANPFNFGESVSISGDTIVVGAPHEDSGATGVNGNPAQCCAYQSGAAYVFVRSGTNWNQQAYLKSSNTEDSDFFGQAVAISGNTVVVGARSEDSNATGVNGNQNNNLAPSSGAAYVFVRNGASWSQQAYLKASNAESYDWFGFSVSVAGDTIAVGAVDEDSNAIGVNGNQSNNSQVSAGAAYVFARTGTSWSQQAYLKASNTEGGDGFGRSVSALNNSIVVGAELEDSSGTGVNGIQNNNLAQYSGAAYLFVRNGMSWSQLAYLKASNSELDDMFGIAVASTGSTIVVGALREGSNATGVNGNQSNNLAPWSGAAYAFDVSYSTGGTRAVTTVSQCPSPMMMTVTGNPEPGGTIDINMVSASGIALAGIGFPPQVQIPLPCGCEIISDGAGGLGYFEFTTNRSLVVPSASQFIGMLLLCQGIEVMPTTGGCSFIGIQFGLTDIWSVTID